MTVISSKEFVANEDKYFDMALSEDVCIKRDEYLFHLVCTPGSIDEQKILKPDDDLRRAITKDELLEGIYANIAKMYDEK
jgi:hypothetical protein